MWYDILEECTKKLLLYCSIYLQSLSIIIEKYNKNEIEKYSSNFHFIYISKNLTFKLMKATDFFIIIIILIDVSAKKGKMR